MLQFYTGYRPHSLSLPPGNCWKSAQDSIVFPCCLLLENRTGFLWNGCNFTQVIPSPLPRCGPCTCWKITQDTPFFGVAIYTGLAVLGLLATLRRLLSAQENGGGIHRLLLVEHTGLSC